jgi:hypothetical protein
MLWTSQAAHRLVFNLSMPAMPLSLVPAIFLCVLSFSAFSFVLAGLVSTPRVAQALGAVDRIS